VYWHSFRPPIPFDHSDIRQACPSFVVTSRLTRIIPHRTAARSDRDRATTPHHRKCPPRCCRRADTLETGSPAFSFCPRTDPPTVYTYIHISSPQPCRRLASSPRLPLRLECLPAGPVLSLALSCSAASLPPSNTVPHPARYCSITTCRHGSGPSSLGYLRPAQCDAIALEAAHISTATSSSAAAAAAAAAPPPPPPLLPLPPHTLSYVCTRIEDRSRPP
jgi:hypothetical protein